MRCHNEDKLKMYYSSMKSNMESEPVWSNIAGRMAISAIAYPFDYAKFLIQIGYEPMPPWLTTTIWGKPALGLPNIFQYISYIKRVDGFYGCYRGLTPRLWAYCIYNIAFTKYIESKRIEDEEENLYVIDKHIDDLEDRERNERYVKNFINEFVGKTIALIVTHPLDVIAVRMMAQFVGREAKYVTIIGSIKEIYKTNWLSGFYAGFIPRFTAQTLTLTIVCLSTYVVNKYIIKDKELRNFTFAAMTFIASTFTYPYLLVSQCMAINDSGLMAGQPPFMPVYKNWRDCWNHLASINQLKRGSTVMWRTVSLHNAKSINFIDPKSM